MRQREAQKGLESCAQVWVEPGGTVKELRRPGGFRHMMPPFGPQVLHGFWAGKGSAVPGPERTQLPRVGDADGHQVTTTMMGSWEDGP